MEKITLNVLLQNGENYNKNKNTSYISDLYISTSVNNELSSKNKSESTSMDQMNKCFKGLSVQSCVEYNGEKSEHLAGKINNVIKTLQIVIVKPYSSDILLYIGTPLFLICKDFQNIKSKYTLLGYIDDIFGPVGKPMYSVNIKCNPADVLDINAHVYYFPNHPNTSHVYIEHTIDKRSNKEKYYVKTKNLLPL